MLSKTFLGLSYFFFWLIDWAVSIQTNQWISIPSSDTSAPSIKAIELIIWVTLITSFLLAIIFCIVGRKLCSDNKFRKSWAFWINVVTLTLMSVDLLLNGFFLNTSLINIVNSFIILISLITVILGIFDFYKLLRTWKFEWYSYGLLLQGLAITMIFLALESMC